VQQPVSRLFDYLIRGHLQDQRHGKVECLRSLEIDDQFEFGRLLDREFLGLASLEDTISIKCRLAKLIGEIRAIRN